MMTDTNRPQLSTSGSGLSRLPYKLTTGVTATREGLITAYGTDACEVFRDYGTRAETSEGVFTLWPDAADLLRYRDGEPWCYDFHGSIACGKPGVPEARYISYRLHRLAAILCDDAEAFRALHYCIMNYETF